RSMPASTSGPTELDLQQVVAREPQLALEPAAAEREPDDAGGGHAAAGHGERVRLGGGVDVAPGRTRLHVRGPRRGVDLDPVHGPHVVIRITSAISKRYLAHRQAELAIRLIGGE